MIYPFPACKDIDRQCLNLTDCEFVKELNSRTNKIVGEWDLPMEMNSLHCMFDSTNPNIQMESKIDVSVPLLFLANVVFLVY